MQRSVEQARPAASVAAPPAPASRLTPALTIGASLAVIAVLSIDLLSGAWADEAPLHLLLATAAVALVWPAARRTAALHLGVLYVYGLFVYTVLRGYADDTLIPVHTLYVIDIDRVFGLGQTPSQILQRRLFNPVRLRPLDWFAVEVHWSYFLLPHLGAALVYLRRRALFPRYVAVVLGTFYAGLLIYFLVPTTPPWLAADNGALPGVVRIMDYVGGQVNAQTYERAYDALGVPNAVAAMPSLHMAITFALTLFAWQYSRRLGLVLLVYAAAMGFSLVYLGEHYLSDVVVGMVVAAVVTVAVRRWFKVAPQPEQASIPIES